MFNENARTSRESSPQPPQIIEKEKIVEVEKPVPYPVKEIVEVEKPVPFPVPLHPCCPPPWHRGPWVPPPPPPGYWW